MKRFEMLLTKDQFEILNKKTKSAGFLRKSEYVRFIIFLEPSIEEKIDLIYKRLIENA